MAAFVAAGGLLLGGCTYSGSAGGTSPATDTATHTAASSSLGEDVSSPGSGTPSTDPTAPRTTTPRTSASQAATALRVLNCGGQRTASRPALLYLTCGDGTVSVQRILWSSFGNATAHGAGVLHRRSCTPNCASGKDTTRPAQVTLSGVTKHNGRRLYAQLLVEAAGSKSTILRLPG